jgi:hypothetical protein
MTTSFESTTTTRVYDYSKATVITQQVSSRHELTSTFLLREPRILSTNLRMESSRRSLDIPPTRISLNRQNIIDENIDRTSESIGKVKLKASSLYSRNIKSHSTIASVLKYIMHIRVREHTRLYTNSTSDLLVTLSHIGPPNTYILNKHLPRIPLNSKRVRSVSKGLTRSTSSARTDYKDNVTEQVPHTSKENLVSTNIEHYALLSPTLRCTVSRRLSLLRPTKSIVQVRRSPTLHICINVHNRSSSRSSRIDVS